MNKSNLILVAAALLAIKPTAVTADEWTGGGTSLNWSDTGNWSGAATPTSSSFLYFSDIFYPNAYTNAAGVVNNVVDANYAAGGLAFTSLSGPTGLANHHYTTLIPSGVTLTLGGLGLGSAALSVGDVPGSGQWVSSGTFTNYTTVTGPGTLSINDSAALMSVGFRNRATLDLTGLNTFGTSIKQLQVGASIDNPNSTGPTGWLLLGKTNTITTAANLSAPGIILGSANNANSTGILLLGGTNVINTDGLVVGGRRAVSPTVLAFGPTYSNTITPGNLILRGSAGGSSRVGTFSIGDMAAQPSDYFGTPAGSSTAVADFSGGTVDIRADNIYVGRSAAGDVSGGGFQFGFGSLILERGTVDVNNLYIAYKQGTNGSSSLNGSSATLPCPLTIKSNAQMTVNGNVVMAFRNNGNLSTASQQIPYGALIVNDSAAVNIGGNVTTPTNGLSLLQLGGGTINMTGGGSLTNTSLIGAGNIMGANTITIRSNLAIGGTFSPGTLNLGGNLVLANPFSLVFDLGSTNTSGSGINDYINVTGDVYFNNNPVSFTYGGSLLAGSNYTVLSFTGSRNGSLIYSNDTRSQIGLDQSTAGQVALVVTNWNPATLYWQGTTATNVNLWSMATNLYWTNSVGGVADRYYQGDAVVFNDTAIQNIVYPHGLLFPASITVDCNTKHIIITNRSQVTGVAGVIGGATGITKNGPGTMTFGTFSNTFTGPINVNNGILRIHDPNFSSPANMPVLGSTAGAIYVANGATLDLFGGSSHSPGKPVVISGNGFNGLGAITNSSTSGSTIGLVVSLAGDSMLSPETALFGFKSASSASTVPPFSGSLNLNGYTLTKLGSKRFSLQDIVATNAGSINVGTGYLAVANCQISGPGSINLSNNTYMTFGISGTLSSIGSVDKALNVYTAGLVAPDPAGASSAPATAVLNSTVNLLGALSITNNQPMAMNGVISGAQPISKYGNSNLVLNAANSYSGQTVVNFGTLSLGASSSINTSPLVTVNPGAALDVTAKAGTYALASGQTLNMNGTVVGDLTIAAGSTLLGSGVINGSLTVNSNAEVAIATTNVVGTTYVSNNVTLAGGHFTWELAPSFDISDGIVVNGNLTLTGTNVFTVNSIGGFDPSGTNTLITYNGTLSGGLNNLIVNSSARFAVEFVDPATTPGKIQIRLVTPSPVLTWKGGAAPNPSNWDIKTSTNWDNAGSPDVFWSSDIVRFDSTANTNFVNLVGTLGPASVSLQNSSYTFGGAGGLVSSSLTNENNLVTFTNTGNSFFTGVGIVLNGAGSVTFAQPTNATLTANLNGGGQLNKAGNSNLTLIGSAANFFGTINVIGGQLRAGSTNAVASTVNLTGFGTLDVNGQYLPLATVHATGIGADGMGSINNRGGNRTNALASVTLDGNTTFGAFSGTWGISGTLTGNGNSLTKTNANDIWIQTGTDTDLGNIQVLQGRLIFGQNGTTLGRADSNVTIYTAGTLSLAATNQQLQSGPGVPGIAAGSKVVTMQSGATFESVGFPVNSTTVNSFDGSISIVTNGNFRVGQNSSLVLRGPISGNSHLTLTNNGNLYLGGTNTYSSNTYVYSGTLVLTNASSLPTNSILAVSNLTSSFGNAAVAFDGNVVFPATNVMRISSVNGIVSAGGNGTWNGPVLMYGSQTFSLSGGTTLFDLAGPLVTTNVGAGTVAFHGSNTRVRGALIVPSSVVQIGVGDGLGAGFNERFTTVTFDKSNNWTTTTIDRGRVNLGTNNAIPVTSAIRIGTLSAGVADRRIIFDLHGYNQVISNITETAVGDSLVLIGNSSETSDSLLTFTSGTANTWGARIVDILDSPSSPHITALTVTSGTLNLMNTNTYSGPTLITGGRLNLILGAGLTAGWVGQLTASPVTVSGTGTLGGNGMVQGDITINAGGTLAPGTSIGTLTATGDLLLNAGSKCEFEVNLGTGTYDKVVGIDNLTLGGTLSIVNVGAQPFTNGTVLQLFSAATYTAGAVSILPTSPGAGLMWDTTQLAVNGTLKVVPAVAPVIGGTSRLPSGNISFNITGTPGQGYSVLASTNVALPLANWTVLSSGTLTSPVSVFTDLTATNYPARFYRASTP